MGNEQNGRKMLWIALIVLIGGAVIWSLTKNKTEEKVVEEPKTVEGGTPEPLIEEDIPEEKISDEEPDENLRQQIIKYINGQVDTLAPPPKDDEWDDPSFLFVGNSKVYLELYAMEADLGGIKILYDVKRNNGSFTLTELARYQEGEDDWILKSGKDEYDEYSMDIYDYDGSKWIKDLEWEWADEDYEEDEEELEDEDWEDEDSEDEDE